jgi:hypothetical protein
MLRKFKRVLLMTAALATTGALFAGGCVSFGGDQFLRVVDFCFLFDCQNGALGGLLHPCPDRGTTTTTTNTNTGTTGTGTTTTGSINLFVDCPPADETTSP